MSAPNAPKPNAWPHIKAHVVPMSHSILSIPPKPVWIHESALYHIIGVPRQGDYYGKRNILTCLINGLKKGYCGDARRGGKVSLPQFVDLSIDNTYGITFQDFGVKEEFSCGSNLPSCLARPRWFISGPKLFDLDVQLAIVDELTGVSNNISSDAVKARRSKHFMAFVRRESNDYGYSRDIPTIVYHYHRHLDGYITTIDPKHISEKNGVSARAFDSTELDKVKDLLRLMIVASNRGGRLRVEHGSLTFIASERPSSQSTAVIPSSIQQSQQSRRRAFDTPASSIRPSNLFQSRRDSATSTDGSTTSTDPLKLQSISVVSDTSGVQFKKVANLASLEFMFHLHKTGLTPDKIVHEMSRHGVAPPTEFNVSDLASMSSQSISNAAKNVKSARIGLEANLEGYFVPRKDELLYEWSQCAGMFTRGANVEGSNFAINNSGNGALGLTLDAGYILRHIMYSFGIPLLQMPSLWAAFYYLIMRKPIPKRAIASQTSIWNHVFRVHLIDSELAARVFIEFITVPSQSGFRRSFGISTDGSKHGGVNRNVVLMTTNRSSDPAVVDPSFTSLTCSVTNNKSSDFNAKKNVDTLEKALGLVHLGYFGGGTNDNAPDAQLELRKTFDLIIERLESSPDPDIQKLAYHNGVKRRVITMGDPYHIANLTMMHFSISAWGDTNKDDHRQVHHRQVLQTIHTLRMLDPAEAQENFERVLRDMNIPTQRLKTKNERIQRWLVNQRNSTDLLNMMELRDDDGVSALVTWALHYANTKTGLARTLGRELAVWLQMPIIKICLLSESENGNYFEGVYAFHCRCGPMHSRSGFRMLELFNFFYGFEMSYWNNAVDNIASAYPKTMAAIEELEDEELKRFCKQQMERGLRVARSKQIEFSGKYLLHAPLFYIILVHQTQGPPFLRAILSILYEQMCSDEHTVIELIHELDSPNWSDFQPANRSPDELKYYNIIATQIDDAVHYWQQFELDSTKVMPELQMLSKSQRSFCLNEGDAPLLAFRGKYPILFDCLHAAFGLLPSNSRLCEQNHGSLRARHVNNIGMDQADARQFYVNTEEYENREKRRRAEWYNADGELQATKRRKHNHTLNQVLMIGEQLSDSVNRFMGRAADLLSRQNKIPNIKRIQTDGRRVQDKTNLAMHMEAAQEAAGRLRREIESVESLQVEAASLQLQNYSRLNQKDEDIEAKQKLLQITKKAHWDSIPTPGKNKGFLLMQLANSSLRKFGLLVHARAEINRMESSRWNAKEKKRLDKNPEAQRRERPKRGGLTMLQCKEPTTISKQNALGLIHLYNKRAVMIAKLIRSFIPPEDLEAKPFDEENLIVSYGLYNLKSEDAWEHIDTTPTSVVTALESFCELDPHYFQTNTSNKDDDDAMEINSTQSDNEINDGDDGSEYDSEDGEGGGTEQLMSTFRLEVESDIDEEEDFEETPHFIDF